MSLGKSNSGSSQSFDPELKSLLTSTFRTGQQLSQTPYQAYDAATVAPLAPAQLEGMNMTADAARAGLGQAELADAMAAARGVANFAPTNVTAGTVGLPSTPSAVGAGSVDTGIGFNNIQNQQVATPGAITASQLGMDRIGPLAALSPERVAAQGVTAQQVGPVDAVATNQINVAPITSRDVAAQTVGAQSLADTDLSPYQSQYTTGVIDAALSDLDRARQMTQNQNAASAVAANAFGGDRQGLVEAETNRAFADTAARTAANLRQAGFQNAQQMAQTDLGRAQQAGLQSAQLGLQADLANQRAGLNAATTSGQLGLQAATESGRQALQSGLAAQNANLRGALANQQAALSAGTTTADQALRAGLANQQAGLTAGSQNLQSQLDIARANQAARQAMESTQGAQNLQAQQATAANQLQASQLNAANNLAAQRANLDATLTAGQARNQGALANQDAALRAGLANQQAGLATNQLAAQVGQANQDAGLRAALANQQNVLAAAQQQLAGAGQLAQLGGTARAQAFQDASQLTGVGAQQQAAAQQLLNDRLRRFEEERDYPLRMFDVLRSGAGILPNPLTSRTKGTSTNVGLGS